jgi:Xaa-Pro aminopeptidase
VPEQHDRRRRRLAELLVEQNLDALLVTSLVNVRYLTGFTGSYGAALVAADGATVFATDGRYQTQSGEQCPDVELVVTRDLVETLAHRARGRVGFEAHQLTVETRDQLPDHEATHWVAPGRLVERLREVKDDDEIELLRQACKIGDLALAEVVPTIRAGETERQLARRLDDTMRSLGAEELAFPTIVAAGTHGAFVHHEPCDLELSAGDLVALDFGARYAGYHADMTRTIAVGPVADWQRELYELVAAAQSAERAALAPGADARMVHEAARAPILAAGFGEIPHGTGHGIGLEIHEAPIIGYGRAATLEAQMPVTVEPGVYLPGRGGVRIEDSCVVRDGTAELLTTTTRELLVV